MRIVCDIETDAIDATVIWCIVCKDIDTGEIYVYGPDDLPLSSFNSFANEVTEWWGHNFLCFDAPIIRRLLGIRISISQINDTLIMSRMFSVYRHKGHGLGAWGQRLNFSKGDFTDFSQYTPEMRAYCIQDVEVTDRVRQYLIKEGQGCSEISIRLEHDVTYVLQQQQLNGFYLDEEKAFKLLAQCRGEAEQIEEEIKELFPPKWVAIRKNKYSTAVELREFNLRSHKQRIERLDPYWKPYIRTKTGKSFQVCEENLATLKPNAPVALKKFSRFLILTSRADAVQSWLNALGKDGRVHGTIISVGATTHRCSHNSPNLANVPALVSRSGDKQLYGKECRECWTIPDPDRRVLVGTDASGIQLRVLAHHIGSEAYIKEILSGDIHTANMNAMNQHKEIAKHRQVVKTFIYAWLLGAQDAKVAEILDCSIVDSRLAQELFIESIPGLKELLIRKDMAAKRGYFLGLDGRRIPCSSKHKILSVYLQGDESIIMKKANVLWYREAIKRGIDFKQCAFVHDEWQTEVEKERADELGQLQVQSIIKAGQIFKMRCPLNGEYKIGTNWCETH